MAKIYCDNRQKFYLFILFHFFVYTSLLYLFIKAHNLVLYNIQIERTESNIFFLYF